MPEHDDDHGKSEFASPDEPVLTPRPRQREAEQDAASYVLIEETDFTALTSRSTDNHAFINPRLREAFDSHTNCVIAVPLFTAKGGEVYERETRGTLPKGILADPNAVTFEGQKVLLHTLVFHESPEREVMNGTDPGYEFSQLDQSRFQTLLHALKAEAAKAASGGIFSRRTAIAAALVAALGLGALLQKLRSESVHKVLREVSPPQAPPPPPPAPEVQSAPESIRKFPGLAAVLASSLNHFEPGNRTLRDPLLRPHIVSEAFLGNRFRYTGQAKIDPKPPEKAPAKPPFDGQRIHTFTVIGNRSSYFTAQGDDRFQDTYLNHAINTLLDYENLSDDQIRQWIVLNYQKAFNVTLEAARIILTRSSKTKEITYVTYDPPPNFENRAKISFAKSVEDQSSLQPGGNVTTDTKYVPLLASDNRLMLQSGISPDHDLYVPENLLDLDKTCDRPLGRESGYGEIQMLATDLARAIHRYHAILEEKQQQHMITYTSDGRAHQMELCSPYIDGTDPALRRLARRLLPEGVRQAEAVEILTGFVQATPYVGENASNYHRPPLITLFNGGSDCNSLVELWSSLLTACKIPHGLFYFGPTRDETSGHVTGAIHESLVAKHPSVDNDEMETMLADLGVALEPRPQLKLRGFLNQELTSADYGLGDNGFPKNEVVIAEFLTFAKNSPEPKINVSTRAKPK